MEFENWQSLVSLVVVELSLLRMLCAVCTSKAGGDSGRDQKLVDSLSVSNWWLHWVGLTLPLTGHSLLCLMSTTGTVVYSFVVLLL